jgi:hypothetical protein
MRGLPSEITPGWSFTRKKATIPLTNPADHHRERVKMSSADVGTATMSRAEAFAVRHVLGA